ncbi:BCCT family transporter [Cellulophaga sp. HaHaR_3_176]|uniref:BCCT family transporter n=1 Tax=Cellulophaga sp. HaHaR_3_176 TaxID=1942464 RepID=UPI001C1FD86F|nr:BCCT family transporter [Cellulophaga sp. HaHaR_3_176]QWX82904.1 BCCT family transporter [Cellulophaga sp. HaHaR_3_176]
MKTKNPLLIAPVTVLLSLSLFALIKTKETYDAIDAASLWVRTYFGYFYLYLGLGCVLFLLIIAFSNLGKIRLGKKNEKPEHSLWSWLTMLYSAGMGSGILLRAVQEPVFMQQNPPYESDLSANTLALEYTFYQWGFTAWAFYGLFAMVIGYHMFVKKKKTAISNTVDNIIPNKIALKSIDVLTILTTIFGLIAAVGLGTTQISGGINHLFNENFGVTSSLTLAIVITIIAGISAWQGVNKGIKIISKLNILIALALLFYIFFMSDIKAILSQFLNSSYNYIIDFVPMSLSIGNYNPGMAFLSDWTFYYWAFWLAWAPFTGIFIARISKGRTLRQILLGVLIIPSLGTFFWFSVFGTSAFQLIENWGAYNNEFGNVFSSIFVFFGSYPMATLLNTTTLFLLVSFLVTSVDSAVFVLSMFTDNGNKNPSKKHRILWSSIILIASCALIFLGDVKPEVDVLTAVQKLLIITSLPFAIFILVMIVAFLKETVKK